MAKERKRSVEFLEVLVASWRDQALALQRTNARLEKRVRELESQLVGAKYRLLEGRKWGRGH